MERFKVATKTSWTGQPDMVSEAKNKGFPVALFDYLIYTSSAVRGDSVIAQEDIAQASTQIRKLSQKCFFFPTIRSHMQRLDFCLRSTGPSGYTRTLSISKMTDLTPSCSWEEI